MGISYGGWLTSQYALRFPGRLDRIVLLAPAATILPFRSECVVRLTSAVLPHHYFRKSATYWILEDAVNKDSSTRSLVDDLIEDMDMGAQCFKFKVLPNPTVLSDQELNSIQVPMLFLVGENEKIYSAQKAVQRLNNVAPQIAAEIIPGCGHDLWIVQTEKVKGFGVFAATLTLK